MKWAQSDQIGKSAEILNGILKGKIKSKLPDKIITTGTASCRNYYIPSLR